MPTKYIAIAIALLVSHSSIFFVGYFKKGEVEADRTTEAIAEAVKKEAIIQEDLIDIGLKQADEEVKIKVVTKIVEKEIIKNVKKYVLVDMCYSPDGVRSINQALGYSESKSNSKSIGALSRNGEGKVW